MGVYKSFEFLIPNDFEAFEVEDEIVEVVFINKLRIFYELVEGEI